jgi:hypothetical protein
MNRSRFPNSNNPSFIDARRTTAVARATPASVILFGILAVGLMAGCSPRMAADQRGHEAVSATPVQSNVSATPAQSNASATPAQSNDPASSERSTEQTWVDPSGFHDYTFG